MQELYIPNCSAHSQPNEFFSLNNLIRNSTIQFSCKQCLSQYKLHPDDYPKHNFREFPLVGGYSLSFPNLPPVDNVHDPSSQGVRMDFMNSQVELIISNPKASGYGPKSLAFIPEKNLLAAADNKSGRIDLWLIGENVEHSGEILIEQPVEMVKYVNMGENMNYLLVASFNQIHIYDLEKEKPALRLKIACSRIIRDLIIVPQKEQLIVLQNSKNATIYSLESFGLIRDIDLDFHGITGEVYSGAYIREDDALAIEDTEGICIINLNKLVGSDGKTTAQYFKTQKQEAGMCYLPLAKQFMLRTSCDQTYLLDLKNFTPRVCYEMFSVNTSGGAFDYIVNQNESQVLCNSNFQHYYVYDQSKYSVFNIKTLVQSTGALAILPHQCRFVVADRASGKLIIFRTNTGKSFRYNQFNLEVNIVRSMPSPVAKNLTFTFQATKAVVKDLSSAAAKSVKSKAKAPRISKEKSKMQKGYSTSAVLAKKKNERVGRKTNVVVKVTISKSESEKKIERGASSSSKSSKKAKIVKESSPKKKKVEKKIEKVVTMMRISKKKRFKEEVGIVLE